MPGKRRRPVTQKSKSEPALSKKTFESFRVDEFTPFRKEFDGFRMEVNARFEKMDRKIDDRFEEAKRFMGVLHEHTQSKLDLLLEGFGEIPPRVTKLEGRVAATEEDITTLKALAGSRH